MSTIDSNSKEKYLVLGGNGFIGSHVVDKLVERGKRVVVLDSFRRAPQFHNPDSVTLIKGSAFNDRDLHKALRGVTHVVYSLAATNPFTADSDPYADVENLSQSVKILEGCVKAGVRKIGFISSGGAVYGKVAEHKTAHEEDVPLPISPYGICKLALEHYMEYFKRKHELDYVVFRLANPYGPRQSFKKEQGVIPAFLDHILNDEPITILGDGTASRDYIFVEDAASMIVDTLTKQSHHTIYNIGSGQQITLNDIVHAMKAALNKEISVVFKDAPRTTLSRTGLSMERFWKEFGVPQAVSFSEGIAKTINAHVASTLLQQKISVAPERVE